MTEKNDRVNEKAGKVKEDPLFWLAKIRFVLESPSAEATKDAIIGTSLLGLFKVEIGIKAKDTQIADLKREITERDEWVKNAETMSLNRGKRIDELIDDIVKIEANLEDTQGKLDRVCEEKDNQIEHAHEVAHDITLKLDKLMGAVKKVLNDKLGKTAFWIEIEELEHTLKEVKGEK